MTEGSIPRRVRSDERNPHHVGRARRAERDARHDDDALARLGEAFAEGKPAGAVHHVVEIARILGDDAMYAPYDREPSAGRDVWRDRDDRRLWPLACDAQRGRARA